MKAIGYMRLSTKDQSKSLEYQESTIRNYCERNNVELIELFKDNGESSYTFDRPDYRALEMFLKKYKGKCDYLVVLDHDRFSRNLPEALMKITELEKNFGVKVISTNERIDLDTSDPDVFMKRAFDYMIANKELFTIRNRTRQGVRNARENGRYLGRAPIGYKNILDGTKRNKIGIDYTKSPIIERVFRDYLLGVAPYIILKSIREMGFRYTSNNAVYDILHNCLYAGLVKVPAYKDLPEKFVKGNHEPIITEAEYWLAQRLLSNKRPMKVRTDEEFPLRGVLKCWCGKSMTAGWSKGKKQYYLYYRCLEHTNINIPGQLLHEQFDTLLRELSFDEAQIKILNLGAEAMLKNPIKEKRQLIQNMITELKNVNIKISGLEEKFMNNEIESSTYKTWFKKLNEEKAVLENSLKPKSSSNLSTQEIIQKVLPNLRNLLGIYEKGNIFQKHSIVRAVFKDSLAYNNGVFRTPYINPTFEHNLLKVNEKGLLIYEQASKKLTKSSLSTQEEIRTPTPVRAPAPQAGASTNFAT